MHVTLADFILRNEAWKLSDGEANSMARAISDTLAEYEIKVTKKGQALTALAMSLGAVYGARITASLVAARERRQARRRPQGGGIVYPGGIVDPGQPNNEDVQQGHQSDAMPPAQSNGEGLDPTGVGVAINWDNTG